MRTQGRLDADTPFTDGLVFFPVDEVLAILAAAPADAPLTRNGPADVSLNQIASKTNTYIVPLGGLIQRLGLADMLQEQFGTAAGVSGPSAVANTSGPSGSPDGIPPFTAATQLNVQTGKRKKGIKITDFTVHYMIGTNPLTTHTCRMDKAVFGNNVAAGPTVTNILASAANGLATAISANLYSTNVPIAAPAFTIDDLAGLFIEVLATTPAGGTYRFYGISVHVTYNLN